MSNDFIFGTDGHVGLSHRKAGELLGVSRTSVWDLIKTDVFTIEEEEDVNRHGIRGEALAKICTYYSTARRITPQARQRCKDLLNDVEDFQALIDGVANGTEQPQQVEPAVEKVSHHDEIRDFIFGSDGHAGLSQHKAAELLKVSQPAIAGLLKGDKLFSRQEAEAIAGQGFRGDKLVKLAVYFSQARRVNPEAKQHCFELLEKAAVIGVQAFIDQLAGVVKTQQSQQPALPQESITVTHAEVIELRPDQPASLGASPEEIRMRLLEFTCGCVEGTGAAESIVKQFKLQSLGAFFPEHRQLALAGVSMVKDNSPIGDNNIPLIPTAIAERLNETLRRKDLKAWHVNDAARQMGWQICQRIKGRGQWELTEEGQKWAVVVLWADADGHSGPQIKWFQSTLPEFAKFFRSQMTGS